MTTPRNDSSQLLPQPKEPAKNPLENERFIVPTQNAPEPIPSTDEDASSVFDLDNPPASPPDHTQAAPAEALATELSPQAPAAQEGTETVASSPEEATDLVVGRPSDDKAAAPEAAATQKLPAPLVALVLAVVLGGISVFVGYRLTRPASTPTPASVLPSSSTATAFPAEPVYTPPKVVFADEHVVIAGEAPRPISSTTIEPRSLPDVSAPSPAIPHASSAAAEPAPTKWAFRGEAFDLMTGDPVFAAKLILLDEKGAVVGSAETGTDGRYELTVRAGSASGYQLKIERADYLDRCIDQGAGTAALRQATPDERAVLIHAAHGRPWIGSPSKPTTHDLALIPKNAELQ